MVKEEITMTIKKTAIALATILLLAACGAGVDPSGSVPETTAPDATPTTTTEPPATTTTLPVVTTTTTLPATTTTTTPSGVEVLIYLVGGPDADPDVLDCAEVWPVTRTVEGPEVLEGAIEALLEGVTEEELAAGYDSWFKDAGWELASINLEDGVAYIDFAEDSPYINNASTSCGSMSFLAQLDMTATQFDNVDQAIYSIGGDAEAFYGWLQRDVPEA